MQTAKYQFTELLRQVQRPGIDQLITYLEKDTDFFSAPASTMHHGACSGGLVEHSLAVYDKLKIIANQFMAGYPGESLILTALLHDLCKANFYRKGARNRKNEQTGQWEKVEVYEIFDQFPIGHGEKSVMLLQKFIPLTDDEMMAIRWHMGGWDDTASSFSGQRCLSNAMKKYPLVTALHMADLAACYFDGK